jgi:hypothetical protein
MVIALLIIVIVAMVCLNLRAAQGIRDIRAERRRIEAETARVVRNYPALFPEARWDKYRANAPLPPSAAKQKYPVPERWHVYQYPKAGPQLDCCQLPGCGKPASDPIHLAQIVRTDIREPPDETESGKEQN